MKKAIIFDLEGTLVTLDRQYHIVNRVLEEKGIHLNIPRIYKIRGFGKYNRSEEFFKGLVAFHKSNLSEDLLLSENLETILDKHVNELIPNDLNLAKEIRKEYKRLRYETLIKIRDKLYPRVKETLSTLSNNYLLGIYTAREKQSTISLLRDLRIDKFFNVVVTGETKRKLNSNTITKTCNSLNIPLDESYVVGDSEVDIIDGKKAGLKTILVLTGNGSIALQKKAKPNYIIEEVYKIIDMLKI